MFSTVTHTGTHHLPDGSPASGTIEIIPSEKVIVDDTGDVVMSGRVKVKLDEAGHYSVDLPATDDVRLTPFNFGYTVVAKLHHTHLDPVSFSLPAAVSVVDITDVTQVLPSSFTPEGHFATEDDLAAAIDVQFDAVLGQVDAGAASAAASATSAAASAASAAAITGDLGPRVDVVEGDVTGRLSEASLSATFATRLNSFPPAGASVARRIKDGSQGPIIGVVGDSTGDNPGEWFELLTAWLGTKNANMPVKVMRFSDAAQGYTLPQLVQAGSGPASVTLNGTTQWITTPDSPATSVTGDLAGMVDVALNDWTPSANNPALLTKFGVGGQRSFRFYVEQTTGLLVLSWYADGSTAKTVKSSVAPTVADGARLRVGFELDVNDGAGSHAVRFYVGTGANDWAQLGTAQVAAGGGTTSVFDSTTTLAIGSRIDSGVDAWAGTLYAGHLVSGALQTGAVVAGYEPGLYPAMQGDQTLKGVMGETWNPANAPTITYSPTMFAYNGSVSGKTIAYSADATRLAKQTPREPHLWFVSYGHNQSAGTLSEWDALATQIRTRWPLAPLVAVAQSPQKTPGRLATQVARQALIAAEVRQVAAVRGYALVDAFAALSENAADYVDADGVHPTPAGSQRWADETKALFTPWPTT